MLLEVETYENKVKLDLKYKKFQVRTVKGDDIWSDKVLSSKRSFSPKNQS